jgi:hypothetical protein
MRHEGMRGGYRRQGLTGLEILILVAIVAGVAASALFWETHHGGGKTPEGIIPLSLEPAEKCLVVAGGVYGYWIQDGTAEGIPVAFPMDSRPGIDAILIPIQLLVWSDPLDMGSVRVVMQSRGSPVGLQRDDRRPIARSSWTVAEKTGVLPLHNANGDDLLEPGETFGILVVAPEPLGPGEHVTITLAPSGGIPLVVNRDIPARVSPVTLLSL